MPSTPSTRLRAELQALGENLSTWGDTRLNEALKRLEEGIAQVFTKAVTGNYTLVSANYIEDEARSAVLVLTGTPGATHKITIPGVEKTYFVANNTDASQTIGTSGGAVATVRAGQFTFVYCDDTDTFAHDPTLDQIKAPGANVSLNSKKITNLLAGTNPLDGVNYQQWLDLRAYAQGIGNSGVLAPGVTTGAFIRWNGTGWVENAGAAIGAGFGTSVTGSPGAYVVNVVGSNGANGVVVRDTSGRIPVPVPPWQDKTANYTAVNGDMIRANSAGGAIVITLPTSPVVDDQVVVARRGANLVTVARGGGTGSIAGKTEDHLLDGNGQLVTLVCVATNTWAVIPGQML